LYFNVAVFTSHILKNWNEGLNLAAGVLIDRDRFILRKAGGHFLPVGRFSLENAFCTYVSARFDAVILRSFRKRKVAPVLK